MKHPAEIEAALDNPNVADETEIKVMHRYFHDEFKPEFVQSERWVAWLRRNKNALVAAQLKGLFK